MVGAIPSGQQEVTKLEEVSSPTTASEIAGAPQPGRPDRAAHPAHSFPEEAFQLPVPAHGLTSRSPAMVLGAPRR